MFGMDPESKEIIRKQAEKGIDNPDMYLTNIPVRENGKIELKDILLEDKEGFTQFVNDYTKIIDKLYFVETAIKEIKSI